MPRARRIVMEITFANNNRRRVFPAMHDGIPANEQVEALKNFLLQAMTGGQSFSLELELPDGGSRVEILNQGNINSIDVFLEETRPAEAGIRRPGSGGQRARRPEERL